MATKEEVEDWFNEWATKKEFISKYDIEGNNGVIIQTGWYPKVKISCGYDILELIDRVKALEESNNFWMNSYKTIMNERTTNTPANQIE